MTTPKTKHAHTQFGLELIIHTIHQIHSDNPVCTIRKTCPTENFKLIHSHKLQPNTKLTHNLTFLQTILNLSGFALPHKKWKKLLKPATVHFGVPLYLKTHRHTHGYKDNRQTRPTGQSFPSSAPHLTIRCSACYGDHPGWMSFRSQRKW